jgi:hypothetical protein
MSPQNIPPNLVQNGVGNQKKIQKILRPQVSNFSPKIYIYTFFQFWDIQNLVNVSKKNI